MTGMHSEEAVSCKAKMWSAVHIAKRCLPAVRDNGGLLHLSGSATVCVAVYSQIGMLGLPYKLVNIGAGNIPSHQIVLPK